MNDKTEYLRRNLNVAKAYGVSADLKYCIARLATHQRIPQWLMDRLQKIEQRADVLAPELVAYRDLERE
jgi:hypothetical protein